LNKLTIYILLFVTHLCYILPATLLAQDTARIAFFTSSNSPDKQRMLLAGSTLAGTYAAFTIGLNKVWYSNYPKSAFHLFNDVGEWRQIDKYGHLYSAYFQSDAGYQMARWTGMNEGNSTLVGLGMGMLFQTTIEVLDGFSSQWGFSMWDMGFNVLGTAAFVTQQHYWKRQRLRIKFSTFPYPYNKLNYSVGNPPVTLNERASQLYGNSFAARIFKDYNANTFWLSINIHDFTGPMQGLPPWLNIAVGIGANNLYGGYSNEWTQNGISYSIPGDLFPRYNQYFLGLDIDWSKIKTDYAFLNALFKLFNFFKLPTPAVELTSLGQWKWHLIY